MDGVELNAVQEGGRSVRARWCVGWYDDALLPSNFTAVLNFFSDET